MVVHKVSNDLTLHNALSEIFVQLQMTKKKKKKIRCFTLPTSRSCLTFWLECTSSRVSGTVAMTAGDPGILLDDSTPCGSCHWLTADVLNALTSATWVVRDKYTRQEARERRTLIIPASHGKTRFGQVNWRYSAGNHWYLSPPPPPPRGGGAARVPWTQKLTSQLY